MDNWLTKIMRASNNVANVPALLERKLPVAVKSLGQMELTKGLPPASIVYGVAAGAFFAFALLLMIKHHWVEGFLTLLPAACFVGFSTHLLKHSQTNTENYNKSRMTDDGN